VGFVLVAACGLGASAACSPDPTPRGFHSPDLAWADDELGLVWLDRNAPYEHVVFARAGLDAKLKAPPFELSQHAWHSDPPLVASDGRGWLAAWTQAGGRAPGLRVRQVGPGGPEGPVRTIVEATVSLCPKLAWTGDAYVVGWREGDGLYLGRVGSHGLLEGPPQRVAETSSIDRCRVALGDDELGVLWSGSQDEDHALALARVSLAGELRDVVEVVTDAPPAAGPIDLAWHDGAWVVAYTSPERAGARTVRVTPSREQAPGPALAREGFVRGLALASAGWLGAAWSETTRAGASRGRIFFDLLARAGEPLELGAGRPWVNASVHDRQLAAVTWSRVASGTTTVHWSVIRLRQDGEALVSEISLADQ
jgi:hypothetical protein